MAVALIVAIIIGRRMLRPNRKYDQNLHLIVSSRSPDKVSLNQIVSVLEKHCSTVNLKRFDETNEQIEASFLVDMKNIEALSKIKDDLGVLSKSIKISFIDYPGAL